MSNQSTVSGYQYNGLGDRLSQTVNGNTTNYTLDLNAGLTQVLNDGTNQYLYGPSTGSGQASRIAQVNTTTLVTDYFMTDALGSVRQLMDSQGEITLANAYEPYGVLAQTAGGAQTSYGFTGEFTDPSGMVYLRARYYMPNDGRFLTRDTWMGDYNSPLSLNRWGYVEGNPVNYVDPTGFIKEDEVDDAEKVIKELKTYNVFVKAYWGYWSYWYNDPVDSSRSGIRCGWNEGEWELNELKEIRKGVVDLSRAMGGLNKFIFNLGYVNVYKAKLSKESYIAVGDLHTIRVNNNKHVITRWGAVHELGHAWDANFGWKLSKGLVEVTTKYEPHIKPADCKGKKGLPGCNDAGYVYGGTPPAGAGANFTAREDFAESVTAYVYPDEAQDKVQIYLGDPYYEQYLYYSDYRTTLRWQYIDALIYATNQYRPR